MFVKKKDIAYNGRFFVKKKGVKYKQISTEYKYCFYLLQSEKSIGHSELCLLRTTLYIELMGGQFSKSTVLLALGSTLSSPK